MSGFCQECGGRLTGQDETALCPACLFGGLDDAPPAEDLATLFPDLTLIRLLGRGGMGCVYEALQSPLNRHVAVKILPLEGRPDRAEVEARFLREGQALAQLDHPHIVSVHQFGEAGGWLYLVMEFISGDDLAKRLTRGPLPWREAAGLAEQLCEGLMAAHAVSIIHRDIKPGNLLLTDLGRLKVADFGLAKLASKEDASWTLTRVDSTLGTPFYMAPEQRRPPAIVDGRADLYSAAVVLHEMLTGHLPMGNYRKASVLSGCPAAMDAFLDKALSPSPDERWPSAQAMLQALRKISNSEKTFSKTRRSLLAGGLVAAAGLSVTYAIWKSGRNQPDLSKMETPSPTAPLTLSPEDGIRLTAPESGGLFGTMAVSEGDLLAISRPGEDHFGERDECIGEVWIYPIAPNGLPGIPVRLRAEHPAMGDRFGFVIDLDPTATLLAVTLPKALPLNAGESDTRLGAVELFRRRSPAGNEWDRIQTLWLDRDFSWPRQQIRAFIGNGVLAVASPAAARGGKVRLYGERDGLWEFRQEITSELAKGAAYFGWYVDPDEDGTLLISACRHTDGDRFMKGAVSVFRRTPDGTWRGEQLVEDPDGQSLSFFGMAFIRRENQLWIGALGDPWLGVTGAGSVCRFDRPAAGAPWQYRKKITEPDPGGIRAGFGQRLGLQGSILTVASVRGDALTDGRGIHYFMDTAATAGPAVIARIIARQPGERWMGRSFLTDKIFAFGHPRAEGTAGQPNSGAVYVFPRGQFPRLFQP